MPARKCSTGRILREELNEASLQFLEHFAKPCHSQDFSVSYCGLSTLAFYAMLSKEGVSSPDCKPTERRTQTVRESDNSKEPLAARRIATTTETTSVASHKNTSQCNTTVKPRTIEPRMG